jgi:endoglucanase Acf2
VIIEGQGFGGKIEEFCKLITFFDLCKITQFTSSDLGLVSIPMRKFFSLVGLGIVLNPVFSLGEIVPVGAGSYTTVRPEKIAALPVAEAIYRTKDLTGPVPTNQWWSSLVWEKFSQNMFPHPLGMVCHEAGLGVSYPGGGIDGSSGNIMGGGVSKGGDFSIGHSAMAEFPDARLADYSDWMITAEFAAGDAILRTSYGHGSPFVFGEVQGGEVQLTMAHKPIVWSGKEGDSIIGLTVRGSHYGLFGAKGSKWTGLDGTMVKNKKGKSYFSVALLPEGNEKTLKLFAKHAHLHVVDTLVQTKVGKGQVTTEYHVVTKAMEGSGSGTLMALYPHHWKYSKAALTGMSYKSVRGEMKLFSGEEFSTLVPVQGLLPMLPKEGIASRERMVANLKKEAGPIKDEFADTYWEGKHLGKLATLSGIAEITGEKGLQDRFVGEIQSRLENWLTASTGEAAPLFYYNKAWGTLIGSGASYGSDDQLNDHHFHYGYFIRAAAEVARLDPAWAKRWSPMMKLIIRDIASSNRKDAMFPYIRCFDLYAGHSWASGHAKFGDGNNQESSSESLNAWYGLMLWGEVTGDKDLRDLGTFLFNTERTAVEEYWFDVSGTNFPKDFPNVALGMIWGGKGAFATWFSADIDCIHGINWLPFTPASIYMGRHPNYVKKNHDMIVSKRKGGADYNNGWGDLVVMLGALNDPKVGVDYLTATPDCSLEGGNTHAFMDHWIHTLDRLGRNDAAVISDYPFTNVFLKEGKKTYAAFNFGKAPMEVTFSDGKVIEANPGMTVK